MLLALVTAETQVLSRLGAVSAPAPGVDSVFVGNYVYGLSSSRLLLIIELSGATPILCGSVPFPSGRNGYGTAIAKEGNYVYIANDSVMPSASYLTIVNVANPTSPTVVADMQMPSGVPSTLKIVKNGNYLYLFPESGDMRVVDVSNPTNPSIVRTVSMTASGGVIVGNRLYTAERSNGVGVWNVSQSDNPTRVGSVSLSGNITEIVTSGSQLYALSGFGFTAVHILDISNPDSPSLQSTFNTTYTADIAVHNNYLYLSSGLGIVQIVDVSNPSAPSEVAQWELGRVQGIESASARLLTAGSSFYRFYSLSIPTNPVPLSSYTVPAPIAAVKSGNKVYTAEELGIGVYDVSVPSAPVREMLREVRPNCGDIAQIDANRFAIAHRGNLTVVEFVGSGSNVIWTHNPTPPGTWLQDRIRVSGTVLAFAAAPGGSTKVQLVDISNPAAPQQAGNISFVSRFDLRLGYLYSAFGTGATNFQIFSVSDPYNPAQVSSLSVPFFAVDIAVGGGYALITGMNGELALVNVASPTTPQLVAQRTMTGVSNPRVAYSDDGYFFVYDGLNRKLEVYRVADFPSNFIPFRTQSLDAQLKHLHFETNLVIGSADTDGLAVYQNLLGTGGMSITAVLPNRAGNAGTLQITIEGTGFMPNATARLERGTQVITPTNVFVRNANRIDAVFDFTGQAVNTQWDVVVRNPDTSAEVRLPSSFTIVEPVPVITSLSPNSTLPVRSFTLTINGELFTPGAQVEIRPPDNSNLSPIRASNVQFISQRQLQATFDLQSLRALNLTSGINVQVVVTNANDRASNAGTLTVRGPSLDLRLANTVYALRENQNLVLEVTVNGAVDGEPIEFSLSGWVGSSARVVNPSQAESLGSGRWRLTFNRAEMLPDGFWHSWVPRVHQMGSTDTGDSLSVHQYRGVRKETSGNRFSNLSRSLTLQVLAFEADSNTTFVLRKGDTVREPTQITRTNSSSYAGGMILEATFPVQLSDLGQWNIEVRYGDETKTLANAVEIIKGTPTLAQVRWEGLSPWQRDHRLVVEGSGFHAGMQAVLVVSNENAVLNTRELSPVQITVNPEGTQLVAMFENLFDQIRQPTWFHLELRSNYTHTTQWYMGETLAPPSVRVAAWWWWPSFFRAGRWETFTVDVSTGAQVDAPILSFVVPFTEADLNAGIYDFEYRIVDAQTGQVLQSGQRPVDPDHVLLITQLPLMPANTTRTIQVEVRVFNSGRTASGPVLTRGRVAPIVFVAVSGVFVAGAIVLDAGCNLVLRKKLITIAATEFANQAGSSDLDNDGNPDYLDYLSETDRQALIDWLLDERNARTIIDSLSIDRKGVFDYLQEAITSEVISRGTDAIKQAIADRVSSFLLTKFTRLDPDSDAFQSYKDTLTNAYFDLWNAQQSVRSGETNDFIKSKSEQIIGDLFKAATSFTESPLDPPQGIDLSQIPSQSLGILLNATSNTFLSIGKDCIIRSHRLDKLFSQVEIIQVRPVRISSDPNEKNGPLGVAGYIAPDTTIAYEIKFENLPAATAGAEEVLVEDTLPDALDANTLEFYDVQVGNKRVELPQGTTTLNTQIDLRPERPVVVRVVSNYDATTRKLSVRFSGIDPNTGDYYQEGFLPPNTNPPQGEGAVRFRIRPRSDAPSGVRIENRAVITFDPHLGANPPIVTNTHTLTLDKQPPQVTVEVPNSAVPETKARLRWDATDDASGVEEVEIWAQEGENVRRIGISRATGEQHENGEVVIRARRFGEETRILARARDRVGNTNTLESDPVATIRLGQPPQFSPGLHLIGIPLQPDANDMQPLFGFQNNQWATYDPATGQYVQYPDANAAPKSGRGTWVVLPNAVQPNLVGTLPDPESRFLIALQPGWNLIANPWTEPLVWHREAVQVRVQGVSRPLSRASELVEPYLWGWEPNPSNPTQGRYLLVSDTQILPGMQTELRPWHGYWIYAKQACTLELPTSEEAALFTGLTRSYRLERNGGWSFRIGAHIGDQYDEVLVGVSGNEHGLQVAAPPDPPTRSAYSGVRLRLLRDGTPMEAEVLPRSRRAPSWTLELHATPSSDERHRTLLITVPDVARLPRGVNPVLRDMQTGERRFLRNSAGWQITVPPEGLTRAYEISLVNTSRLLRIVGVQVLSNRSTHQHTVQFTLSDNARVSITVLAGSQPVRTLEQGRSRSRGVQQVLWDGRDAEGRAMPPGNYQVVIQVETEDGQVVRAVAPITLTR
jgi:hypothetical protein